VKTRSLTFLYVDLYVCRMPSSGMFTSTNIFWDITPCGSG
jgi:hypothetical protein